MTVANGKFHTRGAQGEGADCRSRCTEKCLVETEWKLVGLTVLGCLLILCAQPALVLSWCYLLACCCVRLVSGLFVGALTIRCCDSQFEAMDVVMLCAALGLAYSPAAGLDVLSELAGLAAQAAIWVLKHVYPAAGVCTIFACACVFHVVAAALRLLARARAGEWAQPAAPSGTVVYHGTSLEQSLGVRVAPEPGLLGWARWRAPRASASLHTARARAASAGAEGHGVVLRLEEFPGPRARVTAVLFTDTVRAARLGYAVRVGPWGYEVKRARARKQVPTTFYHGTPALENVLAIQRGGFDVGRSGANAGQMLGAGVYVTTSLEKAMNYAREGGAVFRLEVDLGRCAKLGTTGGLRAWHAQYDSAWAPRGLIGEREENCVQDPRRVRVRDVLLVAPAEAAREHYRVVDRRLRRAW